MAYISATWLVEIISIACTMDSDARHHSVFAAECYKTPVVRRKRNDLDGEMKESPFYIRQKIELGILAQRIARPWVKVAIILILIVYMYGAMSLKYVSGAESLYQGISYTFWGDLNYL